MPPCYRRVVRLEDRRPVGLAAHTGWCRPGRGTAGPEELLPDGEETGLALAAAGQVLGTVSAWLAEGLDPGRVSLALPGAALASTAAMENLEWLLAEHPEATRRLVFEVPEGIVEDRAERMILANIGQLAARGVRVGLAGFGARHGALALLRAGGFAEIGIDGSVVAGIGRDSGSELLINAAVRAATGLDIDCVASGVGTQEQEQFLRRAGCRYATGDLYGPLAGREATAARLRDAAPQSVRTA